MNYDELMAAALKNRSVNQAAKDWDMQQVTLNNYVRGKRVPDFQTAILLAKEAAVSFETVMKACAIKEAELKPHAWFTKKFLTREANASNGNGEFPEGKLYLMLNGVRRFLRRTTDTSGLPAPGATTR